MVVTATIVLFVSFFVMLLAGVPISAGIGIASVIAICASGRSDFQGFAFTAAQKCFSGLDSFSLLALPFFSLGGNIMNKGGIAKRLVRLARLLVGGIPGYLAATNVLANMFFGAVSGSSVAATSAMGSILSPLEADEGYDPNYSAAVNICSAPTGILIPPSGPLILYSITAGGVSVAALFMGGYFVGAILGICVAIVAIILAVRKGYKKSEVKDTDPAWKIWVEAIPFKTFYNLLADTMKASATILFLIAASSIMAYVMARTKIPGAISDMIMSVSDNRYVILLIMNVFLLVMGMFLDLTPAVLIFVPIFLPIARSIGMSDVHFGLMLITNLGIGSVTPPVGSCLFVGCGVAKVKIEGVTKYIVPIFAAMVVALFLITYIPQISLSLPYWTKLIPAMGWNG